MVLMVHFIGDSRPDTVAEKVIVQLMSYGAMGVDLFFVLSGFLITGILYDSKKKAAYFRNFYARRVLRIFPLYYAVLFIGLIIVPHIAEVPRLGTAVAHQVWLWSYCANVWLAISGNWEALPIYSHFWSLAVEEHFYFVWPLIVYFLDGRRLKLAAIAIAVGATLLRIGMVACGANELSIYTLTPGRLDALALGGLMAIVAREEGGISRLTRLIVRAFVVGSIFIIASFIFTRMVPAWRLALHEIRQTAFAIAFCAVLMSALAGPLLIRRVFESQIMVFFGKYSYGLYVFHFLLAYYLIHYRTEDIVARWVGSHTLAVFLQAAFGIGLSVVVSLLSYHSFEKHFLKLKARF
jgi:peptidoglycan/LPS O-acetylase OafA/YrhL